MRFVRLGSAEGLAGTAGMPDHLATRSVALKYDSLLQL